MSSISIFTRQLSKKQEQEDLLQLLVKQMLEEKRIVLLLPALQKFPQPTIARTDSLLAREMENTT